MKEEKQERLLLTARELDKQGKFLDLIKLQHQITSADEQPEINFLLGKSYFALGRFEEAEAFISRSLATLTQENNLKLSIQVRLHLGVCYLRMQDYSQSSVHLKAAENLVASDPENECDDELFEIRKQIHFYLAQSFRFENEYEEAIESLYKSLNFGKKLGAKFGDKAHILLEIGINANLAKNYKLAESMLYEALELLYEYPEANNYLIADLKQQLGLSLLKQNRVHTAIRIFCEALDVYQNNGTEENQADVASAQFMLGLCYLRLKCYNLADEKYLRPALAVFSDPNIAMAALQQACAFIKWVAQDERIQVEPSFHRTHNRSSFQKLEKILDAINRIDNANNVEQTNHFALT